MFGFKKKSGEGKFPDEPFPSLPNDPLSGSNSEQPFNNDLPDLPSMQSSSLPQINNSSIPQTPFQQGSFAQPPIQQNNFQEHSISPIRESLNEQSSKQSFDKNDLVLAKLDNIKSMLDVLNQRISTVESKLDNKRW